MKNIIIAVLLLTITTIAYAGTDYTCLNNCTNQGYMYSYCKSRCSYDSGYSTRILRTDYYCLYDCMDKGYIYGYCKQECSY
ncbi:MAG: hypothetical protein U9O94_01525 [Nanoarchaeota archaeon]|nr:hypothetical protein [Nanoarchaeota archaeon]